MARFDVYQHPDAAMRRTTPFLLDVQNTHISVLATRVVVPFRLASLVPQPLRDLNLVFDVAGRQVVLDTPALAALPAAELKKVVVNLGAQSGAIVAALDVLFGAF